jgi:hypothetical protein
MAKPILIIRTALIELEVLEAIKKGITSCVDNEYHIITVFGSSHEEPVFEVYNVDKEPEINIEELKKVLNESK